MSPSSRRALRLRTRVWALDRVDRGPRAYVVGAPSAGAPGSNSSPVPSWDRRGSRPAPTPRRFRPLPGCQSSAVTSQSPAIRTRRTRLQRRHLNSRTSPLRRAMRLRQMHLTSWVSQGVAAGPAGVLVRMADIAWVSGRVRRSGQCRSDHFECHCQEEIDFRGRRRANAGAFPGTSRGEPTSGGRA